MFGLEHYEGLLVLASIICGAIIFLAFVVGIVAICYLRHLSLPSRYSISSSLPLRVSESQTSLLRHRSGDYERLDDEESVSRIDAVSRPPRPPSLITGHALPVADGAMEEKATEATSRPKSLGGIEKLDLLFEELHQDKEARNFSPDSQLQNSAPARPKSLSGLEQLDALIEELEYEKRERDAIAAQLAELEVEVTQPPAWLEKQPGVR